MLLNIEESMKELESKIAEEEKPVVKEVEEEKIEASEEEEINEEVEEEDEIPEPELKTDKESHAWKKLKSKLKAEKEAKLKAEEASRVFQEKLAAIAERQARTEGYIEGQKASNPFESSVESNNLEPDKNYDKEAWLEWKAQQAEKQLEALTKKQENIERLALEQQERIGLQTFESTLKTKDPEFDKRLNHIMNVEARKIKFEYPNATDAQIKAHLESERIKWYNTHKENSLQKIIEYSEALNFKVAPPKEDLKQSPNFANLQKNMKRNSSLIGGSPAGRNKEISSEELFEMSLSKAANLRESDWNQLLEDAAGN